MTCSINHTMPILRWAGGKIWLRKYLPYLIPENEFSNYHEPFLGAGSVFLSLNITKKAFLSDLNEELINTYLSVKRSPNEVINILKNYSNTEDFYYKIRDTIFLDPAENAARFIFLNQTSFNGIYRVNLKGQYNVPFGHRKKNFLQPDIINNFSFALKKARLFSGDFSLIKENVRKNDLIFLDPPYTVSHNDNGFIKYNQRLFSLDDQRRLSDLIDYIKRKDAYYVLTNAAHKTILEIFEKDDTLIHLQRANLIGGTNAKRGHTTEYIFTNINNSVLHGIHQ